MNVLDIIFIIILFYGIIKGVVKGFVVEVASFVGVILGIYLAKYNSATLALFLNGLIDIAEEYNQAISFVIIFVLVIIVCHILAKIIDKTLKLIMLGWLNKLLGAALGFIKFALIISIILNVLTGFSLSDKILSSKRKEGSFLYKPLEKIVPEIIPFVNWEDFKKNISIKEI